MADKSTAELAKGLIDHLRAGSESEETFWAWESVQEMIDDGRAVAAWDVMTRALQIPLTRRDLSRLGAGVLESLLASHGSVVIDQVEAEALRNTVVVDALRFVNTEGFPPPVADRLSRLLSSSG